MRELSPIRLDVSASIIVCYCIEHPWWRSCRFTLDDACQSAAWHEEREHAGDTRRRDAAAARRRRVAVR